MGAHAGTAWQQSLAACRIRIFEKRAQPAIAAATRAQLTSIAHNLGIFSRDHDLDQLHLVIQPECPFSVL